MDGSNDDIDDMRRFHYVRGNSNKFWWVWTEPTRPTGYLLCCRWGRIGTDGQRKSWFYGTLNLARAIAKDKANKKLAKGYFEVTAKATQKVTAKATQKVCAECGDAPDTAGPLCTRCIDGRREAQAVLTKATKNQPAELAVWISPRRRLRREP